MADKIIQIGLTHALAPSIQGALTQQSNQQRQTSVFDPLRNIPSRTQNLSAEDIQQLDEFYQQQGYQSYQDFVNKTGLQEEQKQEPIVVNKDQQRKPKEETITSRNITNKLKQRNTQKPTERLPSFFDQVMDELAGQTATNQQRQQEIEQQTLSDLQEQSAQPLEEQQQESRQDAQIIANQIQSAIDADELAQQIVDSIEDENWDEDQLQQHNIDYNLINRWTTGLTRVGTLLLYFYLKSKEIQPVQESQQTNNQLNEQEITMTNDGQQQQCRRYDWIDSNNVQQSIYVCRGDQRLIMPKNPQSMGDIALDQFEKIIDYSRAQLETSPGQFQEIQPIQQPIQQTPEQSIQGYQQSIQQQIQNNQQIRNFNLSRFRQRNRMF